MTEPTSPNENVQHEPLDGDARFRARSRALGDPTRHAIYRQIASRQRPVAVSELTGDFALNHTTVRQHLAKLRDAGLVAEVRDTPSGPGRPRLLYRLTDDAAAKWNDEGPYERLSLLLLEVADGTPALEVGRAAGREVALDPSVTDPVEAMTRAIAVEGFAPRTVTNGDESELVLENCPFARAAEVDPGVVCALHRGLLEGLASQLDGVDLSDLITADPRRAQCLVRVDRSHRHA